MEQKPEKFRLRLNLFDSLIILLALAVGAVLLWTTLKPAPAPDTEAASTTVRYTIRFQRWMEGTSSAIHEGARLTDSIRNYELGNVVSAQAVPAVGLRVNHEKREYVLATMSGYEDVIVTVESPCVITEEAITLQDGYALRVGALVYIQGDGFLTTGYVIGIERED